MQGLDKRLILRYASEGITEYSDILLRIQTTENALISQTATSSSEEKKYNNLQKKWCKVHKTTSHDNRECVSQRSVFSKQEFRKGGKSDQKQNSINNVEYLSLPFLMLENSCFNNIKALVDSGANHSFISYKIAETLKIPKKISGKKEVELADGSITQTHYYIVLDIEFGTDVICENVKLDILPGLQQDIILGNDFPKKYNCIINFTARTIKIKNKIVSLSENNNHAVGKIICAK